MTRQHIYLQQFKRDEGERKREIGDWVLPTVCACDQMERNEAWQRKRQQITEANVCRWKLVPSCPSFSSFFSSFYFKYLGCLFLFRSFSSRLCAFNKQYLPLFSIDYSSLSWMTWKRCISMPYEVNSELFNSLAAIFRRSWSSISRWYFAALKW